MPINNFFPQLPIKNKDNQCESVVKSSRNMVVLQKCKLVLNTEKPDLGTMGQFLHCGTKPQYFWGKKTKQTFFPGLCTFFYIPSKSFPLESPRELESSGFPKVSKSRRKIGK